jgi:hypothetical protein
METTQFSAADNPALANKLAQEAMASAPQEEAPTLTIRKPFNGLVTLPGGFLTSAGEVVTTVEVRELNGLDEEAVAKQSNIGKSLSTILSRATLRIGEEAATETALDSLLAGDGDAIMLGIYRATFGNTVTLSGMCTSCQQIKSVEVDLTQDIPTKGLLNPIDDRVFTVVGAKGTYTLALPTRKAQKELLSNLDKTMAELNTILLENCVVEINGREVLSKSQVQAIGLADRKLILKELSSRNPGPQFDPIEVACSDCNGKVEVPISLGAIFRS